MTGWSAWARFRNLAPDVKVFMPVIYTESDGDLATLQGTSLAVIGYRPWGRSVALNLRDSGLLPLVGEANAVRAAQAQQDGFEVSGPDEAARRAAIKLLAEPDESLAEVYHAQVSPTLAQGDVLVFLSGYAITFGFVEPPPFVDAVLVAPRSFGADLREVYLRGEGFLSFVAVAQDASGKAWPRLLAIAKAIGALRSGALELGFQQQAELDLFFEQALLPALQHLITAAAELLVREGYPPEAALLDLYVSGTLGEMFSQMAQQGTLAVVEHASLTRQYGILSRLERFQDTKLRRQLEIALEEIRTGKFAQEWVNEYLNGYPRLQMLRTRRAALPLWALEQRAIALRQQGLARADGQHE